MFEVRSLKEAALSDGLVHVVIVEYAHPRESMKVRSRRPRQALKSLGVKRIDQVPQGVLAEVSQSIA